MSTANGDAVLLVLTTVSTEAEAHALAERLVNARLAACVNALPGVRSLYRWQGKVDDAGEVLLLIKTLASSFDDVTRALKEAHPYELPEIVALRAAEVEARYRAWIEESVLRT